MRPQTDILQLDPIYADFTQPVAHMYGSGKGLRFLMSELSEFYQIETHLSKQLQAVEAFKSEATEIEFEMRPAFYYRGMATVLKVNRPA